MERFDALVVGAGIAGVATAWFLQAEGRRVALLDSHAPGWGASGRNPGFLWLQTKRAGLPLNFALRARTFAEAFAHDRADSSFRASGGLILYRGAAYEAVAAAFVADRCAAGLPVTLLDRAEVRALVPEIGPQVSGAVWNPLDAHQDSAAFVKRLAADFAAGDGRVIAPAEVVALEVSGGRCEGVRLADGSRIAAPLTVLANGPGCNALLDPLGLGLPFRLLRFEAAATAPADFRLGPVLAGQALFRFFTPPGIDPQSLPRDPLEALAPDLGFTEQLASLPDGSLQFGCAYEVDSSSDRPSVAGQALACGILARNLPALAKLPLERVWAGSVMQTADGLPVIEVSAGPEGLALNLGHFFGNLAGAYSGKLLADGLAGRTPDHPLAPFARARLLPG
ncbi:MAG: FAD-dependent oxidoreductase [Rhodospirillales bacterium]